ncbi:MAG: tryptophan synthase subunit alpha [Andreesenia angusta]|nr:tryptophan synthase subunit alpha [Andreesenia angusta]
MSRISNLFKNLKEKNEKALIGYLTFGCPSEEATVDLVHNMEKNGLDLIELGIPYSNPVADGEVIRQAAEKALANGFKVRKIFEGIEDIRKKSEIPIVLLTYFNTVFNFGVDRFFEKMRETGADGILIPDLPLEERDEIAEEAKKNGIDIIPLVSRVSHDRIKNIVKDASGFVYCVSILGVTGMRDDIDDDLTDYMKEVSDVTDLPRAIGFGISNGETAKKFKDISEGVIVGSAFVKETLKDIDIEDMKREISIKVKEIKNAINS